MNIDTIFLHTSTGVVDNWPSSRLPATNIPTENCSSDNSFIDIFIIFFAHWILMSSKRILETRIAICITYSIFIIVVTIIILIVVVVSVFISTIIANLIVVTGLILVLELTTRLATRWIALRKINKNYSTKTWQSSFTVLGMTPRWISAFTFSYLSEMGFFRVWRKVLKLRSNFLSSTILSALDRWVSCYNFVFNLIIISFKLVLYC